MIDWNPKDTKHKVFISYYHNDNQTDRDSLENKYGHIFISKSVKPGDIDSDLSTNYIKRLIQEDYITDSSVVIVLIGPKTYGRKHVDWEISAGLNKKVGNYSGLLGILLPSFPLTAEGKWSDSDIPSRLADNYKTGYADIYIWNELVGCELCVKDAIQEAYDKRLTKSNLIDNSRPQMGRNTRE